MTSFWLETTISQLCQGDYLTSCLTPVFNQDFGARGEAEEVRVEKVDLIVVTQSCDLANGKASFVALCPIYPIERFQSFNPNFNSKGKWEEVRKGRIEGLHLLSSLSTPENNLDSLVVDFREIYSLPIGYLIKHTRELGRRWQLQSPFLEHFSQSFARFFMRVGLPSQIPPFK